MQDVGTDQELGTCIRRARERRHWRQIDLARALDVDVKTVGNWERGTTSPRNRLGAIEHVLGVNLTGEADVEQFTPKERELLELLESEGIPEDQQRQMLEQYRNSRPRRAAG